MVLGIFKEFLNIQKIAKIYVQISTHIFCSAVFEGQYLQNSFCHHIYMVRYLESMHPMVSTDVWFGGSQLVPSLVKCQLIPGIVVLECHSDHLTSGGVGQQTSPWTIQGHILARQIGYIQKAHIMYILINQPRYMVAQQILELFALNF